MKVFLSHAQRDEKLASSLSKQLAGVGFQVWRAEEHILPGDNWALKTGQALKQSDAMIVLVSPEAAKSTWVRKEINFALGSPNYAGRVIPVVVRPTDKMPWVFRKLTMIRAGKNVTNLSQRIIHRLQHTQEG